MNALTMPRARRPLKARVIAVGVAAPLRAAARTTGDADAVNLWAGQAHSLAQALPAGALVRQLSADARTAIQRAAATLNAPGEHTA